MISKYFTGLSLPIGTLLKRQIASSTREKAEPDFVKRDFERLLDSKPNGKYWRTLWFRV